MAILLNLVKSLANVHETKWTPHVKRESDVAQSYTSSDFGQDPIRPEKTWTFWPKNIDVSANEDGRFGQKRWTFRPEKVDVSARKNGHFSQIYI